MSDKKIREGSPLDVPHIMISWDDKKKYHVFSGEKNKNVQNETKFEELSQIAIDIFKHETSLKYSHIIKELQERLNVKERQAKNYLKFMKEYNILSPNPKLSGEYSLRA